MNPQLRSFLLKSPVVRRALRKEIFRMLVWIGGYVAVIAAIGYFTHRPRGQMLLEAIVAAIVLTVMWLLSVARTIRSVLREHGIEED